MSFSQRCKKELLRKEPLDLKGELISLAHFIGSIRISASGFNVIFKTDSNQEARYIYKLIADLYDYSPTFEIQDNPDKKNKRDYVVIIEDTDVSDKLIALMNQGFIENYENIVFITFSIINIILFSIIFASFILFKPKLSKQDTLIFQKYFIQFCFFAVTLCQLVYSSQLEIKNEISN